MRDEIHTRTVTIISTAMALVSGLFWQKAINDTLAAFIPINGVYIYEILVALIVTIGTVILIILLNRTTEPEFKEKIKIEIKEKNLLDRIAEWLFLKKSKVEENGKLL